MHGYSLLFASNQNVWLRKPKTFFVFIYFLYFSIGNLIVETIWEGGRGTSRHGCLFKKTRKKKDAKF